MKKILTSLTFFIFVQSLFAKANLVVTVGLVAPQSVIYNQNQSVKATIKNTGDVATLGTSCKLYYSTLRDFSGPVLWANYTSVKPLKVGESVDIEFINTISNGASASSYYVAVVCDADNEVDESDEKNTFLIGNYSITNNYLGTRKLPYPMIFIHGLAGDYLTWDALAGDLLGSYGLSKGGNMNFCLNFDGSNTTSLFSNDYKNFDSPITEGDYYTINFATNLAGNSYPAKSQSTYDIQSNQSAIFKQGRAVRDAIKKVLKVNNCDKVILVGHSMGGLASREYIQNPTIYQSDGLHHVAKLFTIGTPHGGSNFGSLGLNIFDKLDEKSDAVRDLRYPSLVYNGIYLFGGTESKAFLNNSGDTNCDGTVSGTITGLNEKAMPLNIDYSCIIGTSAILGDDGVVATSRANLNNYPSNSGIKADTFIDRKSPDIDPTQHTELHTRINNCIKGMDEPDIQRLSYEVPLSRLFYGFTTIQSNGESNDRDYDYYNFTVPQNGKVRVRMYNLPEKDFLMRVKSSVGVISLVGNDASSNFDVTVNVNKGVNYLEVSANPTANSFYFPYAFQVDFTPTSTPTEDVTQTVTDLKIYPNPTSEKATISFNLKENKNLNLLIFNGLGQVVKRLDLQNLNVGENQIEIDTEELPSGLYIGQLADKNSNYSVFKLLVEH
jgi:pimeloyl-ACP methyl ester carboxylesterase